MIDTSPEALAGIRKTAWASEDRDLILALLDALEEARARAQLEAAKAALRRLVDDIHDYERVNNLAPNPPRTECWDSVADALALLEGKPAP